MVWLSVAILALVAIAALAALVQAYRQNRLLWCRVRELGRTRRNLLRESLVLWSPLALVIVVFALLASWLSGVAVSQTYKLTTLDEFCEIESVSGVVVPCTGMEGWLPVESIRPAGLEADISHFLSQRFATARQRVLSLSVEGLQDLAANRTALQAQLSARDVLGLEQAPEDDHELARLKRELGELVRTPSARASDVLDIVRFVNDRDARVRRLRELTEKVRARREWVNEAAYAGQPREEQGRLWMRHHLSHLLARIEGSPDAETEAALVQIRFAPTLDPATIEVARRGLLLVLARNEAAAVRALKADAGTPRARAFLYLGMDVPRRCTLASADRLLRRSEADFADELTESIGPDGFTESNSGTFPCFSVGAATGPARLRSLGFKESMRRSIDRWHDQIALDSVRRLGELSLRGASAGTDARAIARELGSVVPAGIHLGRERCDWLHPGNCAANTLRGALESGYADARRQVMEKYERSAEAAVGSAALSVDQRIGVVLLDIDARVAVMRSSARVHVNRIFLLGDLMRLLGWLLVALVAVKSFLYVLALELFHSDAKLTIAFDDAPSIQGEYRSGRRLTIDRAFPQAMITRKQLSNADNNVRLAPWPWSAPLARILRRRYFIFTKGTFLADADLPADSPQAPRGMIASASGGQSIVEWKMQPGEEVIFRYKDFHGASENVQLDSEISLRLSTLLLGRVVFRIARCGEGEGRLLLRADVEDIVQEDVRALPPERMIAWSRHAQFTVHSARTPWKTLLNGYTLVRRDPGHGRAAGLIVVSSEDAGSNLGSIRFVKRIFSAIF